MAKARVLFSKCVINIQRTNGADQEPIMTSEVHFTIESGNKSHSDLRVVVRQPEGTEFESSPLELIVPSGIAIEVGQGEFADAVENYYRSCVGSQGRMISIGDATVSGEMQNCVLEVPQVAIVNLPSGEAGGAW